jgi:hypothetical protein
MWEQQQQCILGIFLNASLYLHKHALVQKNLACFFIVVGIDMGLMYYFATFYKENECLCTFLLSDKID